jgi:SpoVK/Ycf46/Vps4 family AAA+-type ATPase
MLGIKDFILSYDDSIRAALDLPCELEAGTLHAQCFTSRMASEEWQSSLDFERKASQYEHHVKFLSLSVNDSSQPSDLLTVATPKIDPIVATSVTMAMGTANPPISLPTDSGSDLRSFLLSALKRQLVGSVVVYSGDDRLRTTVRLKVHDRVWSLTVASALGRGPHPQEHRRSRHQSQQPIFFWILPSTHITVDMVTISTALDFSSKPVVSKAGARETSSLPATASLLVDTVRAMVKEPMANLSRSFILNGSPGVGKTHAVRVAVHCLNSSGTTVHMISLHGSELMSSGQLLDSASELQRIFEKAARLTSATTGIALIALDECEALVSSDVIASVLAHLLDMVSSVWTRVVFVAVTNHLDDIPHILCRPGRLDKVIIVQPPNAPERLEVLNDLHKKYMSACTLDVSSEELREIADLCVGFVPADLDLLVRRVIERALVEDPVPAYELYCRLISTVGASALRDAALSAPPKTTWDDICGDPGGAKTALRQAIEWPRTKRGAFLELGLSAPRGILLHGPPGCAKSTLARAAAAASSVSFISFAPADVYASSYVGDAEAVIRRGFCLARAAAPCILFFDEIDAIVGTNDKSDSLGGANSRVGSTEARVLSTFLNEMDGVDGSGDDGVLVLGATNRPWTLDSALLRPGRFDKIIFVPPPDEEGRRSLLEMQCCHWQTTTPFNFAYLASDEISGSLTGAEIVGACRKTAMRALANATRIGEGTYPTLIQDDLELALRQVQPLLSDAGLIKEYRAFEQNCLYR